MLLFHYYSPCSVICVRTLCGPHCVRAHVFFLTNGLSHGAGIPHRPPTWKNTHPSPPSPHMTSTPTMVFRLHPHLPNSTQTHIALTEPEGNAQTGRISLHSSIYTPENWAGSLWSCDSCMPGTIHSIHIVVWDIAHSAWTGLGDPLPPSGYQRLFRFGKKFDEDVLLIQWTVSNDQPFWLNSNRNLVPTFYVAVLV